METSLRRRPSNGSFALSQALLAVISLGAAGIHFAVVGEHFEEYVVFGLFFGTVAWLQGLWAVAVAVAASRPLLWAGLVGNLLIVVVWVISRTVGLPFGPEAGLPEPAAIADVIATMFEVALVVAAAGLLSRPRFVYAMPARMAALALLFVTLALATLTTTAIAADRLDDGFTPTDQHADE
jgi:hypothetical protein